MVTCVMGTPVRHRFPFELVGASRGPAACFAFEGGCGLWRCTWGMFSGTLLLDPCWEFIFGVYYGIAAEPCAVVVCYDVHEQFPVQFLA